jgi:hypothetical protein
VTILEAAGSAQAGHDRALALLRRADMSGTIAEIKRLQEYEWMYKDLS